jgi:PTH1 family peptidyl-tRNA hydrolase
MRGMNNNTWLIVGLGNPGREYLMNRHNIGFMAVDALADEYGIGGDKKLFQSVVRSAVIDGKNVFLQKPQTYMNLSGEAVGAASRFYKIPPENIVVIHDEIDIAHDNVRIKQGGGAAGHNGLKSIDQHLGNDYWRIRLGVGRANDERSVADHVLSNFTEGEEEWLVPLLQKLVESFPLMLNGQSAKLQAAFKKQKQKEEVEE